MPNDTQDPGDSGVGMTGIEGVDPNDFLTPEEKGQSETQTEEVTEEPGNEELETPEAGESTEGETETPQPEEGGETETEPEEEQPEEPEEPRLYAGKFKSEDDLRKAYKNLGGDPTRFSSTDALEEAYQVRQSEFTRTRQDVKEARENLGIESNNGNENQQNSNTQPNLEQSIDEVAKNIKFDEMKTPQELFAATVKATLDLVQQNVPDPDSIVNKVETRISESEKARNTIRELEEEAPRLRDSFFRSQFSHFINTRVSDGSYSGNLKAELKEFLHRIGGQPDQSKQNKEVETAKSAAEQPKPAPQKQLDNEEKKTEWDEILEAHSSFKSNPVLGI